MKRDLKDHKDNIHHRTKRLSFGPLRPLILRRLKEDEQGAGDPQVEGGCH